MKASELRIGNLVLKHNGEITKVSGQFIADFEKYGNETLMTIPPRPFYTGIPLTSEWLERFGFKPTNNNGHYFEQAEHVIYHCKVNKISGRAAMGIATFDDDGYRNGYMNFAWDFQYVHQLQNLYFALTGEELTIKDDGKKEGKEQQESSRAESQDKDSLE